MQAVVISMFLQNYSQLDTKKFFNFNGETENSCCNSFEFCLLIAIKSSFFQPPIRKYFS
jgi:hypothetical protein